MCAYLPNCYFKFHFILGRRLCLRLYVTHSHEDNLPKTVVGGGERERERERERVSTPFLLEGKKSNTSLRGTQSLKKTSISH